MVYENKTKTNDGKKGNVVVSFGFSNRKRCIGGDAEHCFPSFYTIHCYRSKISMTMVTTEQEVCSIELAKQLYELGVAQNSKFAWNYFTDDPNKGNLIHVDPHIEYAFCYSAFTVAELGEMLPPKCRSMKIEDGMWFAKTSSAENVSARANTEANARALLLIYLKRKEQNI